MLEPGSGPVVALLGAESTGKSTLAQSLAAALCAAGRPAVAVAEYLREFCDAAGRTPRRNEQAHIAAEQWRRIVHAAHGGCTVLADTTPLMTAVYSDIVFSDTSLYAGALALQAQCRCHLVTGLDLAWQPDGLQRDGPQVRGPVDALLRQALTSAGLAHSIVYGTGPSRTAAALAALKQALGWPIAQPGDSADPATDRPLRLRARCRECLAPECEHRVLADRNA